MAHVIPGGVYAGSLTNVSGVGPSRAMYADATEYLVTADAGSVIVDDLDRDLS